MSGGGGDTTTTTKSEPWGGVQPYLKQGYGQFDQAAQNIAPYYPDQTYAGFTQPQQQGQQSILNYSQGLQPTVNNGLDSLNFGLTAVQDPNNNPYLSQYVDAAIRPLNQQYQEQILPGIRDQAEMYGGAGSRTGLAEGVAARGLQDATAATTANIYSNAYGQGLDQQARMQALLPSNPAGWRNAGAVHESSRNRTAGHEPAGNQRGYEPLQLWI